MTVRVDDGHGGTVTQGFTLTVAPQPTVNLPPAIASSANTAASSLSDFVRGIVYPGRFDGGLLRKRHAFRQKALFSLAFPLLRAQNRHAFQIPCQAHQGPLVLDVVQTAGEELAQSHHRFDDAEDRLHALFA